MRDFRQGVGLIHKLGQLVRTEERVDNRRQGLRVDQVNRGKHLVVTNVHPLADGPCHTCEAYAELRRQLLPYRTYTSIGQVVDIIDFRFGIDKFDQIFYDGDDIFLGQDLLVHSDIESQFLVHSIASYLAQIVTLVGEKQLIDDTTCRLLIGRLGITQLTIDMLDRFLFGVGRILL